ncbi:glycosyltransferase [Bacteriovorax sp. Seq25_V]|uniref:glycosyltransferase n=1 Tax=Bacteriovorax sp. Seq25_V TaxID=1201288 RepID=UPI00038A332A|nr:glycosyltransferase [Bacteriovorax sp. Seq25_V]EQC43910.1 glycosyltransferase family 28 C-terminal domain protein [Bacteriovorax sp. Seq25_V]
MARILLTSIGSLGDVNPIIALGKYLKANGHVITLATCERYRNNIQDAGLDFICVRPNYDPKDEALCKAIVHPTLTLYYVHKLILTEEQLELSINDFCDIVNDYDFVIGNVFSYAAKIACLKNNVKWVSLNLCALCFFSSYDPPALYPLLFLQKLKFGKRLIHKVLFRSMFKLVDYWGREVHRSYERHGLGKAGSLMLEAPFSKDLNIALFPKEFGTFQKDWPINTVQADFLNYSGEKTDLSDEVKYFLNNKEKPILVTLGSVAVYNLNEYLEPIIKLIENTKDRYILTIPDSYKERYAVLKEDRILLANFLPYTSVMPLTKAVIHQGGIGTVSNCYQSKVFQIIIPSCTDQFDNAYRVKKIGHGDFIPLKSLCYTKLKLKYSLIETFSVSIENGEHDRLSVLLSYLEL